MWNKRYNELKRMVEHDEYNHMDIDSSENRR